LSLSFDVHEATGRSYTSDVKDAPSVPSLDDQDELAELLAGFEAAMRRGGLGQGESPVDDGAWSNRRWF
jgi:hypothetical protein